jgi:hypothetical protein
MQVYDTAECFIGRLSSTGIQAIDYIAIYSVEDDDEVDHIELTHVSRLIMLLHIYPIVVRLGIA